MTGIGQEGRPLGHGLEDAALVLDAQVLLDSADSSAHADADSLYRKLEQVVLPLYDTDRPRWIAVMKGAIAKNASFFNSHQMMRRYASDAYLR